MTDILTARVRRDFLKSCEAIRHGSLILTTPEGTRHDFGTGGPVAELILHDWAAITATAARGDKTRGKPSPDDPGMDIINLEYSIEPRRAPRTRRKNKIPVFC